MPQRFYLDEENLDQQLEKLDTNLFHMLDFAYLHEDMVNTIEELMSDWAQENLNTYQKFLQEWEEMSDDEKQYYEDINEYLMECGRWWIEDFSNLSDDDKKMFIRRYRLTISACLHSGTYDHGSLKESIEESWQYEMV
jgi:hypothetical protein